MTAAAKRLLAGWRGALFCTLAAFGSGVAADGRSTRWSYVLPDAATTSAGVYTPQGVLVRTLWRAEPRSAGEHQESWDNRDDSGAVVPDASYEIKLVHYRLTYVWEGVIGNSSESFDGALAHKAYLPPAAIVISGDEAFYAVGYNEGQPGLHGFRLAAPQSDTHPFASTDPFVGYSMIAVDATRLYWADTGGLARTSLIAAYDLKSRKPAPFPAGVATCLNRPANSTQCYPDQDYKGVVDVQADPAQMPTGLAVQPSGRILAVAHGGQDLVRLFDKASGELLRELPVPLVAKASNQLAMSPGGDLWVVSGRAVLRFTDLEREPRVLARIDGLEHPVALAAQGGNDEGVWVADGGNSSQLKRFDGAGRLVAVVGVRGGYASDPLVAPDKLCFLSREGGERTAIAVSFETLWVVDTCNNRMLRFRLDRSGPARSDAELAYLPAFYTATVDHGQPRRVFANFLEFDVDDDEPLVAGRSWRLMRNWLAGMPAALVDERSFNGAFGGFLSVETLANGRTYAMLAANGRQAIVELPASGPMRVLKLLAAPLPGSTAKVLYENGDLGYALTGKQTQSALRLPLTGFDGAGDPVWAAEPVVLAKVPVLPGSPHYRGAFSGMPPRFPVTASGRVVFFDQSVEGNEGFHLGAAALGGQAWLWQASPTGRLDGKGSFQTKAIDHSLNYGGNAVWASGRHIVYGYHGEFYKDLQNGRVGQANQFMDFDETGLFLGQFGHPSTQPPTPLQAGMSGNAFSPTLVRSGTRLYLYHNDEWAHGGVHRWRIDGADELRELRGSGTSATSIVLR